jgi:formylglycine-generating enzyme required for sulfatase activity
MHGNVLEWCNDWYAIDAYPKGGLRVDPMGADAGTYRVLRGGAHSHPPFICRSATRNDIGVPSLVHNAIGFRVAIDT